jgi:hypothetical protein
VPEEKDLPVVLEMQESFPGKEQDFKGGSEFLVTVILEFRNSCRQPGKLNMQGFLDMVEKHDARIPLGIFIPGYSIITEYYDTCDKYQQGYNRKN